MATEREILDMETAFDGLRTGVAGDLSPVSEVADQAWATRRDRPVWLPGVVDTDSLTIDEAPQPAAELADTLRAALVDVGLNTTGPRHFGWVPGGGVAAAAVGDYLADLTNVYAGYTVPSPGAVAIERVLLRWMADLVGMPAGAEGDLCSGGSPGNSIALHAATPRVSRVLAGERTDLAVVPEDLDCIIYLSEERHRCIDKALSFIGHGGQVREVRVDERGRMVVSHLAELLAADQQAGGKPWVVVASAGTTGTGAIDPLPEIADLCEQHGLWMHVDAAYGGFFALCDGGRARLAGIERADSVVLDPHKGLFLPYGLGAVLVRDGRRLYAAHTTRHAYIREGGHHTATLADAQADGSAMFRSPELSRPFRALRMWLSLQAHGVAAFRAALAHKLALANLAWDRLGAIGGVQVGPRPDLSIVCFRLPGDDDDQEAAIHRMRANHGIFMTSTAFRGQTWLRLAILNLHAMLEDVEAAIGAIEADASRRPSDAGS